jgi:hypothetical protein
MTETLPPAARPPETLPPDPAAYDSPRAERARARGLAAPYIPGGGDPEPERTARQERIYLRLLIAMVIVLAFGAFVVGIVANLLGVGV